MQSVMDSEKIEADLKRALKREIYDMPRLSAEPKGTIDHPLMVALKEKDKLSPEQLKQFCDLRYHAASQFEVLLEHAQRLAVAEHKPKLAAALHRNLCDERGLEHAAEAGAHSSWRDDFLKALDVPNQQAQAHPLYEFSDADDLPTLAGMLVAAETSIPPEDGLLLRALRTKFPNVFTDPKHPDEATPEQKKATLYLADHIRHDTERHLPELMDAIVHDFPSSDEQEKVRAGITRFANERKALFDHIQQVIGFEAPDRSIDSGRAV